MDGRELHILLVEDDPDHRDLISRSFTGSSVPMKLIIAKNIREAKVCLSESVPDLAVVDLLLSDGRGTELLSGNKETLPYPVVVMTGYGSETVAVDAMKAGAFDYIVKSTKIFSNMPRICENILREWREFIGCKQHNEALRQENACAGKTRAARSPLSKEAAQRLEWFVHYEKHRNARLTCRHFGISPETFYRWKRRYSPNDVGSLEDDKKNRRPKKLRMPTTPAWIVGRIKEIKEAHPEWGRDKIFARIKEEGANVSASTVGRIVGRLKKSGILKPPFWAVNAEKSRNTTPSGNKNPTGYEEYLSLFRLWEK